MPYIYADVDKLDRKPLVGSHHCVALVQEYAKAPQAELWKQGTLVRTTKDISKGTAIATFVNGKYPNKKTGNHAALFISQDNAGIKVMDQWKGDPNKPTVSVRTIRFKGAKKGGGLVEPLSNNGDAYYIIE